MKSVRHFATTQSRPSGETMTETFQDDDNWSESDGVRVRSAVASLAASKIALRAAEYLVWQQPGECAPRRLPALIDGAYGVLSATASIVACLAETDLNALRRDQFRRISAQMSELLVDLQKLSRSGSCPSEDPAVAPGH
jgi:hypothetical protein